MDFFSGLDPDIFTGLDTGFFLNAGSATISYGKKKVEGKFY